ncbi:UNVERIFIED_ORG: hypothetical protein QE446_001298 [Rhizobium sp. SORGH_AS260]|nr:hypothetical protein [Rhizobium sp. SORGH_AS_0260]
MKSKNAFQGTIAAVPGSRAARPMGCVAKRSETAPGLVTVDDLPNWPPPRCFWGGLFLRYRSFNLCCLPARDSTSHTTMSYLPAALMISGETPCFCFV